jgi:hypothetical protein
MFAVGSVGYIPLSALALQGADNLGPWRDFPAGDNHNLMVSRKRQRLTNARLSRFVSGCHSLYDGMGNAPVIVLFCDLPK